MPEPSERMSDDAFEAMIEAWQLFAALPHECESMSAWRARVEREVREGARMRCCGGTRRDHEPGCEVRAAELARSGRFDD